MWEELQIQIVKPAAWLKLGIGLLMAYAIYRFGRQILRWLQPHIGDSLYRVLSWLWVVVMVLTYMGLATQALYLTTVPFFFGLGRDILTGLEATSGKLLLILALTMISWKLIGSVAQRIVPDDEFTRRSVRIRTLKGVVESTLRVVVVLAATVALLQAAGVNASGLLAGVSVLGLAVSFGAQALVKDLFSGFFILLEDQYGVGDDININKNQLSGTVEALNLRVTQLRDLSGTLHIIPNGQINTVSVTSRDWARFVATVNVTYTADIDKALRVLEMVSQELYEDEHWRPSFLEAPDVQGVTALGDDGVTLRALYKMQPKSQYALGREFNRRIKIAMDEAGIEIPSPQRQISFGSAPIEIKLVGRSAAGADTAAVAAEAAQASQNRNAAPIPPSYSKDVDADNDTR